MLHRLHFRNENVTVHVADGANLRQACLDHGIDPYPLGGGRLSCHGKGFCGTCAVEIDDKSRTALQPAGNFIGRLGASVARRKMAAYEKAQRGNLVLSCRMQVKGDLVVTTNPGLEVNWKAHTYYSGRPARSWEKSS